MDSNMFMGLFISALVVLVGLAGGISTLIIKPVVNLNKSVTKLESSITSLTDATLRNEHKINEQEVHIDNINMDLRSFEGRISKIEGAKKL